MKIEHPDLPFAISGNSLIRENGAKESASPEVQLLGLCYLKLVEIAENTKPHKLEVRGLEDQTKPAVRGKKAQDDNAL